MEAETEINESKYLDMHSYGWPETALQINPIVSQCRLYVWHVHLINIKVDVSVARSLFLLQPTDQIIH